MRSMLLAFVATTLALSCNSKKQMGAEIAERTAKSPEKAADAEVEETITPPLVVTGASLTCPIIESNTELEVSVQCRFVDQNQQPIPLSRLAKDALFSYAGILPAAVSVTQLQFADETGVGSVFSFRGAGFDTLLAAVAGISFDVDLIDPIDTTLKTKWGGKAEEITTPPPPRWVRHAETDTNANGACDPGEICAYAGNGILWLADDGLSENVITSSLGCRSPDLNNGYDGWRLPRHTEMQLAFEKGIWSIANLLNLDASPYWAGNGYVPGQGDPAITFAVDMSTGVKTDVNGDLLRRSVCVRTM